MASVRDRKGSVLLPFDNFGQAVSAVVLLLLTPSPPIPLRLYSLPYWSNRPFLIFDIRALWHTPDLQSTRMSKIKNGGLDQYGAEPFEQQQFGTAGVEGVKQQNLIIKDH